MREKFLELLACPNCGGDIALAATAERAGADVVAGELACASCDARYPIRRGIPRFVPDEDYASSFGWQWQRFHQLQRDSYGGGHTLRELILERTGWTRTEQQDNLLLECGCGSGNDTEILVDLAKTVISFDLSASVDAFLPELRERENLLVMQADIMRIPVKRAAFDTVYCHRVIQHTPDPARAFTSMAQHVRPGGEFFLHCYDTHPRSRFQAKYLYRPLTTRLPHEVVYKLLETSGRVFYPLVGALQKLGPLGYLPRAFIPFRNLDRTLPEGSRLTPRERYELSLLVTFDALTPTHDHPQSPRTLERWFRDAGFSNIELRGRNPVLMKARLPS